MRKWLQIEINVLKFDYMLMVSRPTKLDFEIAESFVRQAIQLYQIGEKIQDDCYQDAGVLALRGLLAITDRADKQPNDISNTQKANARLHLQTGFLVRRLTAGEEGKKNRSLMLNSTSIHLSLGLPSVAFEQYTAVKVKEMLNDTLSYVLFSRISQSFPFKPVGANKFSADDELASIIRSIGRMESRVDDFLYTDIQEFKCDQACDMLELKWNLKSSFTKILCLMERRRIARLKGEVPNESLEIDIRG